MKTSSLSHKTIRPGNLNGFNYYRPTPPKPQSKAKPARLSRRKLFAAVLVLVIAVPLAVNALRSDATPASQAVTTAKSKPAPKKTTPTPTPAVAAPVVKAPAGPCADNSLDQLIKVSVSQRHMWACEGTTQVHEAPVITGIDYVAETLTPRGTYKIYGKQTDARLTGSDSTGSWDRHVDYWLPFLSNQYGVYGFHDATWRPESEFGNVDPNSADASHGCVELPLSDMAWLYSWSVVGTTLTIVS